jgi:flavin reductase (DIM6/NTAB) family NADH-FMN oxidoreductase RutF
VTIHSEHPFSLPEDQRDSARRLRGRLGGTVTLLTAGDGSDRAGLTVSSVMLALGEPAHVLALVDPDSDLADRVAETGAAVLQVLDWRHRDLAEAFAGVAPAPGGPFRMARWEQTAWGPRLDGCAAWAGLRVVDAGPGGAGEAVEVGWSRLLDGVVEEVALAEEADPLLHRRGRYVHLR